MDCLPRQEMWLEAGAKDKSGLMTGAQLMDEGLNVTMGENASEIVWIDAAPAAK